MFVADGLKKKMKITYYVHDLKFPLTEGYRKEAWYLAQEASKQGYEVEIRSTVKWKKSKKKIINKERIKIIYGNAWNLSKCKTDFIHYLSQPTPYIIPLLLRAKAKKQIMTIFGGHLNSFWERPWDNLLSRLVNKKIEMITVQTDYQKELFKRTKITRPIKKIPPLIPNLKKKIKRSREPSLLYMSHLEKLKGIDDIIKAFLIIRKKRKKIKLVIADSGMTKDHRIYQFIRKINKGDIILKKIVNPEEELSQAWVYLYPLRSARETFSVPLSLIEAIQVGTPYISTTVGGIPEYFYQNSLVPPKNVRLLAKKIMELIDEPIVYPLKKKIENKTVSQQYLQLYQ